MVGLREPEQGVALSVEAPVFVCVQRPTKQRGLLTQAIQAAKNEV